MPDILYVYITPSIIEGAQPTLAIPMDKAVEIQQLFAKYGKVNDGGKPEEVSDIDWVSMCVVESINRAVVNFRQQRDIENANNNVDRTPVIDLSMQNSQPE